MSEGLLDPLSVTGSVVLGDQDGSNGRGTVPERIGKSFDPGAGCVGRDQLGSSGIDSSLDQGLPDIKAGLMKGSDKAAF